jgi:hypothetical protein
MKGRTAADSGRSDLKAVGFNEASFHDMNPHAFRGDPACR